MRAEQRPRSPLTVMPGSSYVTFDWSDEKQTVLTPDWRALTALPFTPAVQLPLPKKENCRRGGGEGRGGEGHRYVHMEVGRPRLLGEQVSVSGGQPPPLPRAPALSPCNWPSSDLPATCPSPLPSPPSYLPGRVHNLPAADGRVMRNLLAVHLHAIWIPGLVRFPQTEKR